jgi:parallel beta-helix repeat protein
MMTKSRIAGLALTVLITASCGEKDENNGTANNGEEDAGTMMDMGAEDDAAIDASGGNDARSDAAQQPDPPYDDCSITVWPAADANATYERFQNALFDVESGGVVCLVDGDYSLEQEISLDTSDVEIRGESQQGTILDFADSNDANGMSATSDGVTFSTFTIRNTPGDAIRVTGANGVTFRDITVTWSGGPSMDNGAYGLYPVQCQNVLIEGCSVSFASDAGIYVGQSMNIIVRDNEAFGNVAGIEIENSTGADVYENHAYENTGGLLVFDLPSPPIQGGNSNKIHNNVIENNNEPNFAEPGNIVGLVPKGTGVLLLSSDNNEIHDNEVTGNETMGIGVISFQTTGQPWDNPDFDPYAEGNWVHDNTMSGNGTAPAGFALLIADAADLDTLEPLLWDGWVDEEKDNSDGSLTNCFSGNVDDTDAPAAYRMFNGPQDFANQSTDLGDNDCMHEPLDPTELE